MSCSCLSSALSKAIQEIASEKDPGRREGVISHLSSCEYCGTSQKRVTSFVRSFLRTRVTLENACTELGPLYDPVGANRHLLCAYVDQRTRASMY